MRKWGGGGCVAKDSAILGHTCGATPPPRKSFCFRLLTRPYIQDGLDVKLVDSFALASPELAHVLLFF